MKWLKNIMIYFTTKIKIMTRFNLLYEQLKHGISFNWDFGTFKEFHVNGDLQTIQDIDNRSAIGYHVQEYVKRALHNPSIVLSLENREGQIYIYY